MTRPGPLLVGPPTLPRSIGVAVGGAATAAVLLATAAAPPPRPRPFLEWWDSLGTARAVAEIVHLGAASAAALLALTGAALVVAALQHRPATWARHLPAVARAFLGVVAATAVAGSPASAEAPGPLLLVDTGEAPATTETRAVLVDLGPLDRAPGDAATGPAPAPTTPPGADDEWVVEPGDHLWHIAEATLADHAIEPSDATVGAYWARLVDANAELVGDDPDLIHPGDVVVLPPVDDTGADGGGQGW